ncbi:MAG TPA: sugar phosphate isomerase/epimerase [Acidobacteriota bacterium]|nr:sugar phosphate isomerase/epimerase [Acidobacteriota bacterium]
MRVGLLTVLFGKENLDQVIQRARKLGISDFELGTGNYPGDAHCKLEYLNSAILRKEFQKKLEDGGIRISALSCHGNPIHPDKNVAKTNDDVSRKTVQLAEKLGVHKVIEFSGCPGDSNHARYPNWVTCPWPDEYRDLLAWQWDKVVIPYWVRRNKHAEDHGVSIALEMHPGFVVYSPETMLKLRTAAGERIGANLDPSHLFWQGIDPIQSIRTLGKAILHVHAKDTKMYPANVATAGVLDVKPYSDEVHRSWLFRTVGYGHGPEWWAEFISTLQMVGYDDVLSIEHEDSLMAVEEGLGKAVAFLNSLVIREKLREVWWAQG